MVTMPDSSSIWNRTLHSVQNIPDLQHSLYTKINRNKNRWLRIGIRKYESKWKFRRLSGGPSRFPTLPRKCSKIIRRCWHLMREWKLDSIEISILLVIKVRWNKMINGILISLILSMYVTNIEHFLGIKLVDI